MRILSLALLMAAGVLASTQTAQSQARPWFGCSLDKTVAVIPGTMVERFRGQGYRCSMLDIDRTSSRSRACALKTLVPGNDYQIYSQANDSFSTLDCAAPSTAAITDATIAIVTTPIKLSYKCDVYPGSGTMRARHLGADAFEVTFSGNGGQFYEGKGTATNGAFQWTQSGQGQAWVWRFNIVGGALAPVIIKSPDHREDCSLTSP